MVGESTICDSLMIDRIAETPEQPLQELTGKVNDSAKRFGLRKNINKTKTTTIGRNTKNRP